MCLRCRRLVCEVQGKPMVLGKEIENKVSREAYINFVNLHIGHFATLVHDWALVVLSEILPH
jgi:hypothetical protein